MKTFLGTMALVLFLVTPVLAQTANSTPPAGADEDKVGGVAETATTGKAKGYSNHTVRLEACQSKASGDSCSFMNRKGKRIAGVCAQEGKSDELLCRPNKKGKGHRK